MRRFAVGDIHGNLEALNNALERVNFTDKDHLIVTGDMFDRGKNSKEVFALLNSIPSKTILKGNHELILRDVLDRGDVWLSDIQNGIGQTIDSFTGEMWYNLPPGEFNSVEGLLGLKEYIDKLPYVWEDDEYLAIHSFNQSLFSDDPSYPDLVWAKPIPTMKTYVPEKTILFGHWHASQIRESFGVEAIDEVFIHGKYVALDTCTIRSNHLGIVELIGEGNVKIW